MSSKNVEGSMREDEIKREKSRTDKGSVKLYSEFLNKLLTQGDPILEKKRLAYLRKLHKEIKPKVYERLLEDTRRREDERFIN